MPGSTVTTWQFLTFEQLSLRAGATHPVATVALKTCVGRRAKGQRTWGRPCPLLPCGRPERTCPGVWTGGAGQRWAVACVHKSPSSTSIWWWLGIRVDLRALPRPFGDICSCTVLTLQTKRLRVCRERKTEGLPRSPRSLQSKQEVFKAGTVWNYSFQSPDNLET